MSNKLQLSVFTTSLIFVVTIFLAIYYSHISLDAPYYLSVSRDIAFGSIPYKDVYLSYTPLMMYLNALVYLAIDQFNYKIFLGFQFFIMLLSQLLLFKLVVKYFKFSKLNSALISVISGLAILSADGTYINLEVYLFLTIISALYFYFGKHIFLTGFFLGLSFLFKQYGILNFIPFFLLILFSKDEIFNKLLSLSFGAVCSIIIFLFYFVVLENVALITILKQLSGYDYAQYALLRSPDFITWFLGAKVFFILLLPAVVLLNKKLFLKQNLPWLIGALIHLMLTFFQAFQHYVILAFPYIFMLYALNWKSSSSLFFKSLLASSITLALLSNFRILRYKHVYSHQIETAETAEKVIPKNTRIFLNGDIRYLYCLNNYKNPLKEEIGYSYFHFLTAEDFKDINILSPFPIENLNTDALELVGKDFYLKL
ncbi:hypothetical protein ACNI3T_01490 [Christiangramia sp. ASW11-125]|uniref:hypothetical protein n=1 Tax=Christiangramia sp. ASW11-125 TaxID=3400701 RepID=UPI003AB0DF6C